MCSAFSSPRLGYFYPITLFLLSLLIGGGLSLLAQLLLPYVMVSPSVQIGLLQIFSALGTYLLPPLLVERLSHHLYGKGGFSLGFHSESWRQSVWIMPLFILSLPIVEMLYYLTTQVPIHTLLPTSLSEVLRTLQEQSTKTLEVMLGDETISGVLRNLTIVVLLAAVAEEIFFRGALQGWLFSRWGNPHAAVWISAILFSTVHLQWEGFPSRIFMGVLLGYLALYVGLWASIGLHMVNNLFAYIGFLFTHQLTLSSGMQERNSYALSLSVLVSVFALWLSVRILRYIKRSWQRDQGSR